MTPDRESMHLPADARIVVIGGANTDIIGFSDVALRAHDSNPGHVRTYAGGVARNIAENLARLGARVELIAPFGMDPASVSLAGRTRAAGVGLDHSLVLEDLPGAQYVAINDEHHALALAISDMRAVDALTADVLAEEGRQNLIAAASAVVVDANLSSETLEWVAGHVRVPLIADTVSAAKATRLRPILGQLEAFKPNALEAAELLGHPVDGEDDAVEAAAAFVALGVKRAFVTPGAEGIAWADAAGGTGWIGFPPARIANTIGAGDSFVAGVTYAIVSGAATEVAGRLGAACSAVTLGSEQTVDPLMSHARAASMMKELFE